MRIGRRHMFPVMILLLLSVPAFSDTGIRPKIRHKKSGDGVRLHLGTALNFYRINERHASPPKQLFHFTAGFRRELRVTRDYRSYFLFGADYVLHGLSFNSYFFKPDSVKLYDKRFHYKYSVYNSELHVPLQLKLLLRREDNSPFSPYLLFGYHFRYLLPANVKVMRNSDDKLVKHDNLDMKFRNHIIHEKVNASVSASLGWQINNMSDFRGSFFAEINFQYGFSDYYFTSGYSAASLFINCTHVSLLIGSKF